MIRAMYFPEWPEAVLFFVPDRDRLSLSDLRSPITGETLTAACNVPVRVMDAVPGRWTQSILRASNAAKAERRQKQNLATSTAAALGRGSSAPRVREQAEAVLKKQQVDEQSRALKQKILDATVIARETGRYMDRREFVALEAQLQALKDESQALQTRLTQLKREKQKEFEQAFIAAARDILDKETFHALVSVAHGDEET